MRSRTKQSSGYTKIDGESIENFEKHCESNIKFFSFNLKNKSYTLDPLRPLEIFKPNKKSRFI